jgi:hypothetical protein
MICTHRIRPDSWISRFLVASPPARDLLFFAKHLFVAANTVWHARNCWPRQGALGPGGRAPGAGGNGGQTILLSSRCFTSPRTCGMMLVRAVFPEGAAARPITFSGTDPNSDIRMKERELRPVAPCSLLRTTALGNARALIPPPRLPFVLDPCA